MGGGIGPGYFSLSQGQCGSVGRLLLQEWTLHLQLLPLTWLLSCQDLCIVCRTGSRSPDSQTVFILCSQGTTLQGGLVYFLWCTTSTSVSGTLLPDDQHSQEPRTWSGVHQGNLDPSHPHPSPPRLLILALQGTNTH